MARHRSGIAATLIFLLFSIPAFCNGLEFKLTLSGKLLLGVAYRHQIDPNTAIRLGSYMGVAGAPVGLQLGIVQDFIPAKEWTPTFGISVDAIIYKKGDAFSRLVYPSAVCGISFSPEPNLRHSGELWIGWVNQTPQPMGLSYIYLSKLF